MNDVKAVRPIGLPEAIARTLWRGKLWILLGCVLGVVIALFLASQSRKVYRAEIVLHPAENRNAGLGGMLSQVGGLGALVGLELGGDGGVNASLATLRGKAFTAGFIARHQLAPFLAADRWDAKTKRWKGAPPTPSELVKLFDDSVRTITEDRRTGLVTVRIHWTNPAQAAEISQWMVADVNSELRAKALKEHKESLDFLQQELARTSSLELRQTIFSLMESHLKQIVLANVRSDFAFQAVDGPLVPTDRDYVWPRRVLMCALGFLIGGLVGLFASLLIERRRVFDFLADRE